MGIRSFRPAMVLVLVCGVLLIAGCAAGAGAAEADFVFRDGQLTVTTGRYVATIDHASLTSLKSKLTDEVFAAPSNNLAVRLKDLPVGLGRMPGNPDEATVKSADAAHPWRSGYDTRHLQPFMHRVDDKTKVAFKRLGPAHGEITWTGLAGPGGGRGGSIVFDVSVLPDSGDLQIEATARLDDTGVFGVGVGLVNFSRKLNWIFPILEGAEQDFAARDPDTRPSGARWPYPWFAGLVVAESKTGALSMWMTDRELMPRYMHWKNNPGTLDMAFESLNHAPYNDSRTVRSRTIRVNVYRGNWVTAARPFRDHWETTFKVKPLDQRQPDWLTSIRGVMSGYSTPPKQYVDKIMTWAPQRWKVQPKVGDGGLFPYDIEKGPELYMIKDNRAEERQLGVHRMVYLNINHMNRGHPWTHKFWDHRIRPVFAGPDRAPVPEAGSRGSINVHCAYKPWQDLIIDWAHQSYERFGIRGYYMDCASGKANTGTGLVRGLNDAQGQVELMKRMKERIPGCFLSCEYLNEVTAQVVDFGMFGKDHWFGGAQGWREEHVHPLGGFLFNRYAWMHRGWNPAYHETLGKLSRPEQTTYGDKDVTDYAQTESWWNTFFELQAATMMRAVYPEQWSRDVRAYYRGGDGTLYKVYSEVRPEGRMVKVLPDGREELIYWRIKGRHEAELKPGTGIGGWIAYRGDTAIGLNPARGYLYLGQPRIDDWTVTDLPEGAFIERLRPYKSGTLVLRLGTPKDEKVTGKLTVRCSYPLSRGLVDDRVVDLDTAKDAQGKTMTTLELTAPCVVVLTGQKFDEPNIAKDGTVVKLAETPTELEAYHERSGIRAVMTHRKRPIRDARGEMVKLFPGNQLGVMEYLLKLPEVPEGKKLVVEMVGNMNRDRNSFTALVMVNGQVVIEEKVKGENSMQQAQADITKWAGRPVLITLGIDRGRLFRHGQLIRPRILVK